MGSPITFSGFNQIDWTAVLNAVMTQESQPLGRLQTQKTTLQTQNSALSTLGSKLGALQGALSSLRTSTSLESAKATSSSSNIDVSAGSTPVEGTYSVVVSQLARAQVTASSSTWSSTDTVVATGGALTINTPGGTPVQISVTVPTTLSELADAINAESTAPVSAAVVQVSPGSYTLVLTSKQTGLANGFELQNTLSGGSGVTFTDTDNDGTSGDDAADSVQSALNAQLTVNGLAVESASNIVAGVIPGATMTLRQRDPAQTVTIGVSKDTDAAVGKLQKLVDAFNAVVQFQKDQETDAAAGKASLARDPLLRGFRNEVRAAVMNNYAVGGSTQNLPSIGLGFDKDGKLTLDTKVFKDALTSHPADVQHLLSGTDATGGVANALNDVLSQYMRSGGLLPTARKRLTDQMNTLDDRMQQMQDRLAIRRASLQKEYIAADQLMSQISSQGSSLSQLNNIYRLY